MDKEKVIKGLECHRIDNNRRINCADCPYYVDDDNHININCVNDLHDDAIGLLKERKEKDEKILTALDGYRMCDEMSKNAYDNLTKLIRSERGEVE